MVSTEDPSCVLILVHHRQFGIAKCRNQGDPRRAQGSVLLPVFPQLTFLPGVKDHTSLLQDGCYKAMLSGALALAIQFYA